MKRTRIVATIGPASRDEAILRALVETGMDVARINLSHSSREEAGTIAERIRRIEGETGRPVALLGDLRGPRVRVGPMEGGRIELPEGTRVILTPTPVTGTAARISVSHAGFAGDVAPGATILLDDGNLVLEALSVDAGGEVACRVVRGGSLSSNRGVNLPGRRVSLPALTDKDRADVDFLVERGFDFVALSFVQDASDVAKLNALLRERGADIPVIAKIEKESAVADLGAILKEAYGVMVARGDLALEMSLPDVPIAQKRILAACRAAARPAITATQMLESMTESPKPTRAEVSDVANAILDGTDAVMLSGESSVGKHPVEAVRTLAAIATRIEGGWKDGEIQRPHPLAGGTAGSAIGRANQEVAAAVGAVAMTVYTSDGESARWLLAHRPALPVLALCPSEGIRRRLALTWGAASRLVPEFETMREVVPSALRAAREAGLARPGDRITINGSRRFTSSLMANLLAVDAVPE